jgi:hypothetical protein
MKCKYLIPPARANINPGIPVVEGVPSPENLHIIRCKCPHCGDTHAHVGYGNRYCYSGGGAYELVLWPWLADRLASLMENDETVT